MPVDERTVVVPFKEALSGYSFVGYDRSYQWVEREPGKPYNGNDHISFSYDHENDNLVFEAGTENLNDEEDSSTVGGNVYLYPTEHPEELIMDPHNGTHEYALRYAEVIVMGSFIREGTHYTVEVLMHED